MKNLKVILVIVALGLGLNANSQIRIGGSVDISVNFPSPKVVIIKEEPRPVYTPKKVKKHKVYKPKKQHCEVYDYSLGIISNQNGRYGRVDLVIVDAVLENIGRGFERITYFTNTRETIEIVIRTTNPNDYNYHYNTNQHCNANTIISVALNGHEIPLRDGSISLQPGRQLHSVVNLHSFHEGNFNGTVTF